MAESESRDWGRGVRLHHLSQWCASHHGTKRTTSTAPGVPIWGLRINVSKGVNSQIRSLQVRRLST